LNDRGVEEVVFFGAHQHDLEGANARELLLDEDGRGVHGVGFVELIEKRMVDIDTAGYVAGAYREERCAQEH
jgi:hypothetical protein